MGGGNVLGVSSNGMPPQVAPGTLFTLMERQSAQLRIAVPTSRLQPPGFISHRDRTARVNLRTALLQNNGSWQQLKPANLWHLSFEETSGFENIFSFDNFAPTHLSVVGNHYLLAIHRKLKWNFWTPIIHRNPLRRLLSMKRKRQILFFQFWILEVTSLPSHNTTRSNLVLRFVLRT